jgi:hypothetical protein
MEHVKLLLDVSPVSDEDYVDKRSYVWTFHLSHLPVYLPPLRYDIFVH